MTVPVACTVAGSDSGGGAGIQADLLTFAACGVHPASCVVAITAQSTVGVRMVEAAGVEVVRAQIDAVAEDLRPAAWKTGMLASAAIVEAVAQRLAVHGAERLVVDPVMAATSGARLLAEDAVATLRALLLPRALVVTPNLAEAQALTAVEVSGRDSACEAARRIAALGPRVVVVTGGHATGGEAVTDWVWDAAAGGLVELRNPRVPGGETHGTGCTLSAAIAAFLARGVAPLDAVSSARAYLQGALLRAPGLGAGPGPLGHLDPERAAPVVAAPPASGPRGAR